MHSYHLNLFLSGTMLGASMPSTGLGVIGVLFAVINLAAYVKGIQNNGEYSNEGTNWRTRSS